MYVSRNVISVIFIGFNVPENNIDNKLLTIKNALALRLGEDIYIYFILFLFVFKYRTHSWGPFNGWFLHNIFPVPLRMVAEII